ncbi:MULTISPECIES: cupin domain-containing protein [Rothia]|uniref:cupin domain-containing protein n=1 Tax=Rothia TaxID=32207 RepID=UPI00082CA958|nr:cupin domain-containing protein [Rothia sp. ND6WE1A]SIK59853.1 cupin domain-containing protein [Mycobacteroides abscessus subsp. abscessus]
MSSTPMSESQVAAGVFEELPLEQEATKSQVVFNNEKIRQVSFAMDTNQVLTEHSAPRAVIVNILQGKIEFTVGGTANVVVPGDVIYLAPNDRHAVKALEPSRFSLTLIDMA